MTGRVSSFPVWASILLLVAALAAAYANSWSGPFVFDDTASIPENPTIQRLTPLSHVLSPPNGGETVSGRPVLNLSFAINYAVGRLNPRTYHIGNELIHLAAALTLFGIVRRTVRAVAPAFATALLWAVHPLLTEAVTYTVQRAESLMGLFYLLTLYSFIRFAGDARPPGAPAERSRNSRLVFAGCSVLFCLLGMATKEVMVSAPLMVLLYDVTFVAGSFRQAARCHGALHLALFSTWIFLGWLVAGSHDRGGTAGFGAWIPPRYYWVTQGAAVLRYLALAFWPHPLVFDYGFDRYWIHHMKQGVAAALPLFALLAGSGWLFFRGQGRRWLGFLGLFFFAILAPTSVMPGTRQTMAEHRMYLALIPIVVCVVAAARNGCRGRQWIGAGALAMIGAGFIAATARRNQDYQSAVALWGATVRDLPDNPYARSSYGTVLFTAGRPAEAAEQFRSAVRIYPDYAQARADWGTALIVLGRAGEGILQLRTAVQSAPDDPQVHWVAANGMVRLGNRPAAHAEFAAAVRLQPYFPRANLDWGNSLLDDGQSAAASQRLRVAVRQMPDSADAHNSLAITLAQMHREGEAAGEFAEAIRCDPAVPEPHNNLANVLKNLGRIPEARAEYQLALRLKPDYADARKNLARLPP
jgi:tetratricopeptide (TPR) repeat protein